jgi:hypothetical protein
MNSTKNIYLIGGVAVIFILSALMFYQHHLGGREGFASVEVPADLNRAPVAVPNMAVPTSIQRPTGVPGPASAPSKAIATPKEVNNLDEEIMIWLDGSSQKEREHPSALTPAQRNQRVIYQGRVRALRHQLGTGKITDTSEQVNREMLELREQNATWLKPVASLESVYKFGTGKNPDAFLDPTSYKEFRALFEAGINELKGHSLADPLQTVRLQQLQIMEQELKEVDRKTQKPPIRFGPARLYLQQMLQPSQPLPSLLSLDRPEDAADAKSKHETNPANILTTLKDIQWTLTVRYNPGEQALMKSIADMIRHFESGKATSDDVIRAREELVNLQNRRAVRPIAAGEEDPITQRTLDYNPAALIRRATRLCEQINEAFPGHGNAEALGCPKKGPHHKAPTTRFEAETIINTVCDRIRTSVPTVTPEQFNCPKSNV